LTPNNVLGYVSSTISCPLATIDIGDTVVENPDFLVWKRQDNYVLLTLLGTYGPEAQIVMSSVTSSANAMLN